ncbi:alpha/beta hydrolase [Oxalobacteraceae bacterium OTU3CINTB1]|nr:alpha/beta hydrolase [Oxalobacteraceae bacterium OTU3CINTB1]
MTKFTLPAVVATALLLASAGSHAAPPPGQDALAGPKIKVDVGGRKLNMYCIGKGSPTVLFEADIGRAGWDWSAVLPEVAKRTRACVYDRAGLGSSDPIIRASTVANASKDLNFLIKNARLEAPFVVVGAGYGGMVAQHFALRSRGTAVSGLILVQPLHEDALPADRAAQLDTALACLTSAEQGKGDPACTYPATSVNGDIGQALAAAQAAQAAKPTYWRARASEWDSLETSAGQLRTARKPFGDIKVAEVKDAQPSAIIDAVIGMLGAPAAASNE